MTEEEKAAKADEPEPEELPEWAKVYDPASEDYYYCTCPFIHFAVVPCFDAVDGCRLYVPCLPDAHAM